MLKLYICILLFCLSLIVAKEDDLELPLCPLNIEYFPQELPMHCRMPKNTASNAFGLPGVADSDNIDKRQMKRKVTLPPEFAYFQSPSPDKLPPPISFPVPPFPMPGMPLSAPGAPPPGIDFPIPGPMLGLAGPNSGMPGPMPVPMPGMPLPMPMPMPMPGGPAHKMPVIVMPFYSQDRRSFTKPPRRQKHKKRPHRHDSFDTDLNSDEFDNESQYNESSEEGWWKVPKKTRNKNHKGKKYGISRRFNRHHKIKNQKKQDLLTPILQYVTKDGYVIFEKRISNNEAKDWLGPKDGAIANKEIKLNEVAKKAYQKKNNYKSVEINEEQEELDKDTTEDIETEQKPRENMHKKEDSRESNEINEKPVTEKPRRRMKQNPLLRPGPQP